MSFINSVIKLSSTFSKKLRDDCIGALAAQATLFILISFFPFLMFLLTLLRYVPIADTSFMNTFSTVLPDAVYDLIMGIIEEVRLNTSGALISVTIISALWSASKGFLSIVKGLNNIYSTSKTPSKNYFILRFSSVIYTIIFAVMIIVVLLIFVFGNKIAAHLTNMFPIVHNFALLIISIRTAAGLGILLFFFLIIYMFIPTRSKKTSLLAELPGAFITSVGWMSFSYLYSIYIDSIGSRSVTYGSLTAIVLCILWMYACMYIMFIGAEINSLLANSTIKNAVKGLFRLKTKNK